ncbi:MAG TPA: hypothetical protein VL574_13400 [Stellaceae bacterium]|nr:hypothetical protein [Stellaceae bacterium]
MAAPNLDYRQPDAVPSSWLRYAQLVQYRFKELLAADNEVAYRFHLFLENRTVNADAPPDQLIVKVWVAHNGKVQKIEFPSLHDAQADKDLHAILGRGNIGEAPPADMLQPIHLRLQLQMPN